MVRSPLVWPLARQIEQGTRTIGSAKVLLRPVIEPEARRSPAGLQASAVGKHPRCQMSRRCQWRPFYRRRDRGRSGRSVGQDARLPDGHAAHFTAEERQLRRLIKGTFRRGRQNLVDAASIEIDHLEPPTFIANWSPTSGQMPKLAQHEAGNGIETAIARGRGSPL